MENQVALPFDESQFDNISTSIKRLRAFKEAGAYTQEESWKNANRLICRLGEITREYIGKLTKPQRKRLDGLKNSAWELLDETLV